MNPVLYTATIECAANIENLYKALQPEAAKTKRFEVSVKKTSDSVGIHITALDAIALKAVTISIIRLIEAAEKIHGKKRLGTIANAPA